MILHLGKYYFPEMGGIENLTFNLAYTAYKNNYKVNVICFGSKIKNSETVYIDGIKVTRFSYYFKLFSQPLSFSYFLNALSNCYKSKIIHVHLPNYLALLIISLIYKNKIKIILHWHSDVVGKYKLNYIFNILYFIALKKADVVLATSINYAKSSKLLKNYFHKIKILPIGVNKYSYHGNDNIQKIYRITNNKKYILSVGRLVEYKGFEQIIKSLSLINSDYFYIIVGNGPLLKKYNKLATDLGVESRFIIINNIDNIFLSSLYKNAELFCLPSISRAEAFGIVLVEAMSYGLPLVCSVINGSGVNWVNQHNITGVNINMNDPVYTASTINKVLIDTKLKNYFSENSYNRYNELFTLKMMEDKYLKIISEL